jgi:hypothetical protein
MSAPNTNVEKQAKKHSGPLYGIIGGLALAAILLVALLFFVTDSEEGAAADGSADDGVGVLAAPPTADGIGDDDGVPAVD